MAHNTTPKRATRATISRLNESTRLLVALMNATLIHPEKHMKH